MRYRKIWEKVLRPEEKVIKEFSLAKKYIIFIQIIIAFFVLIYFFIFWPISILFLLGIPLAGWYLRKSNVYCLTEKRILVHRGWLSTQLISVNYKKITDIVIQEPFLEKVLFQSGHISINTAGSDLPEIILKHIEKPHQIRKKIDKIKNG